MHNDGLIMKATNTVALAGVLMPAWLPSLATVSAYAAVWVPILSAIWLVVQIARAVWGRK